MKKILFVEDEKRLQETMEVALKEAGYNVFTALDGEEAIKIVDSEKLDLVLLDLILPKKDGFDVLEHMKKNGLMNSVPVIILTNLEEKFDIEKAMAYGVRAYLVKANYHPKEIVEKINEVLKS